MSARLVPPTPIRPAPTRGRWPALACLFAFVVVVHLSLMAASMPCGTSVAPRAPNCTEMCSTSLTRACTVVEQAVEPIPLTPFVLFALFMFGTVALYRRAVILFSVDWLWHPHRRRALLQVFLI